jgi:hypothetical protein
MYGAAWMTVFSEIYTGIALFILVKKYTETSLQYKNFLKVILAGIIMGGLIYPLQNLSIFYSIALAPIIYFICVVGLKIISKETIKSLLLLRGKSDTNQTA